VTAYTPPYIGRWVAFGISAAVTGGQLVQVASGVGSGRLPLVAPCGGSAPPIGVAGENAPVGGFSTLLLFGDLHRLTASGAITTGQTVYADAVGGVTAVSGTRVVGMSMNTVTAGQPCIVLQGVS
jgi:hypothetical protein